MHHLLVTPEDSSQDISRGHVAHCVFHSWPTLHVTPMLTCIQSNRTSLSNVYMRVGVGAERGHVGAKATMALQVKVERV